MNTTLLKDKGLEVAASRPSKESSTDSFGETNKSPKKIIRILAALTRRSLNRFEAEKLADHCLHSTVSAIQRDYDITVSRTFETVPGYMGLPTRCCRYWLEDTQKTKAMMVPGVVE